MNPKRNFSLLSVMFVFATIAILAAILLPRLAKAQPYGTNIAGYGVHQFNDSLIQPLAPSRTLAEQLARGINCGKCVTTTDGTVTNTFSTNYVYSAPPIVVCTQTGTLMSTTNAVVSVTTTNFVLRSSIASLTNNWIAIGQ